MDHVCRTGNHKHNPAYSNWYALDWWVKEYGILNGTALTDAITTDCFLRDFQLTYATLFSGVRHDSGDPFEWGEKMIRHYESLGIDPKRKHCYLATVSILSVQIRSHLILREE